MDHSLLPSIRTATLPVKYEAARLALAECNRIDECKEWADKSAALASYAKQSDDKTLERTAMRIRARAIQRCGQLLEEFEAKARGGPVPTQHSKRKQAGDEVGLSDRQRKTALRVARVNGESFEEQVESENPPTISELAKQGTQTSKAVPIYERLGMTKEAFQAGMHFRGGLRYMIERTEEFNPQDVADGSDPEDRNEIRHNIKTIEKYFGKLIAKL